MERFVCLHGHFYQVAKESFWLESVGSRGFHENNECVISQDSHEATSGSQEYDWRIAKMINNYASIGFNFGPTLLAWMEKHASGAYNAILAADRQSMERRSGHGAALAQVYNNIIMPLAGLREKYTQVRWGISDFQHRFKRFPEGMWLAETAVDTETLEVLAGEGIRFTILASHQAGMVRNIGSDRYIDVSGSRIDTSQAYLCRLPSERSIAIFFYDGIVSPSAASVALPDSEKLTTRLMSGYSADKNHRQLVQIAADGKTYGNIPAFCGISLEQALNHIEDNALARLTNYGEFLELNPPVNEVKIIENSSWSCMHGIERWRNDCGCNSGVNRNFNQQWRRPLREALDWLNAELAACYEKSAASYLKNPWKSRNDYISIVLDKSQENVAAFLQSNSLCLLDGDASLAVLGLLEMQRYSMLMFSSCSWSFDELFGVETVQILLYAGLAIQLAERYCRHELETDFLEKLALAASNKPEYVNGAKIYTKFVKPAMSDL